MVCPMNLKLKLTKRANLIIKMSAIHAERNLLGKFFQPLENLVDITAKDVEELYVLSVVIKNVYQKQILVYILLVLLVISKLLITISNLLFKRYLEDKKRIKRCFQINQSRSKEILEAREIREKCLKKKCNGNCKTLKK